MNRLAALVANSDSEVKVWSEIDKLLAAVLPHVLPDLFHLCIEKLMMSLKVALFAQVVVSETRLVEMGKWNLTSDVTLDDGECGCLMVCLKVTLELQMQHLVSD